MDDHNHCLKNIPFSEDNEMSLLEISHEQVSANLYEGIKNSLSETADITTLVELASKAHKSYIPRLVELLAPYTKDGTTVLLKSITRLAPEQIVECIRILLPHVGNGTEFVKKCITCVKPELRTRCITLLIPHLEDPVYLNEFYEIPQLPWDATVEYGVFVLAQVNDLETIYVVDNRTSEKKVYKYKAKPDKVLRYIRESESPDGVIGTMETSPVVRCDALLDCIADLAPIVLMALRFGYIYAWVQYLSPNMSDATLLVELAKRCPRNQVHLLIELLLPRLPDARLLIDLAKKSDDYYIYVCVYGYCFLT